MSWWDNVVNFVEETVGNLVSGITGGAVSGLFGMAADMTSYDDLVSNSSTPHGNIMAQAASNWFDTSFSSAMSALDGDWSQQLHTASGVGSSMLQAVGEGYKALEDVPMVGMALKGIEAGYRYKDRAMTTAALAGTQAYEGYGDWQKAWRDSEKTNFGNAFAAMTGNLGPDGKANGYDNAQKNVDSAGVPGASILTGPAWRTSDASKQYTVDRLNQLVAQSLKGQAQSNLGNVFNDWAMDPFIVAGKALKLFRVAALDRPTLTAGRAARAVPDKATWVSNRVGLDVTDTSSAITEAFKKKIAKAEEAHDKKFSQKIAQQGVNNQAQLDRATTLMAEDSAGKLVDRGMQALVDNFTKADDAHALLNHTFVKNLSGNKDAFINAVVNETDPEAIKTLVGIAVGDVKSLDKVVELRASTLQMLSKDSEELSKITNKLFTMPEQGSKESGKIDILFHWDDAKHKQLVGEYIDDLAANDPKYQALVDAQANVNTDLDKAKILADNITDRRKMADWSEDVSSIYNMATNQTASKFKGVEDFRMWRAERKAGWQINPTMAKVSDSTLGRWSSYIYRATPLHMPVQFVHWLGSDRPAGWIALKGPESGNGSVDIANMLDQVSMYNRGSYRTADGLTGGQRKQQLLGEYLAAGTPSDRYAALSRIEQTAMRDVADHFGIPQEMADTIYGGHSQARQRSIDQLLGRGYVADGEGGVIKSADAVTHLKDKLPIINMAEYEKIMGRNAQQLQIPVAGNWKLGGESAYFDNPAAMSLYRGARKTAGFGVDAAYSAYRAFESVWKPMVLLFRLGYPVRNTIEAQMRSVAYIHTLGAMNKTASTGRAFSNVGTFISGRISNAFLGRSAVDMMRAQHGAMRTQGELLDNKIATHEAAVERLQTQHDALIAAPPTPVYEGITGVPVEHGTSEAGADAIMRNGFSDEVRGPTGVTAEESPRYYSGEQYDPGLGVVQDSAGQVNYSLHYANRNTREHIGDFTYPEALNGQTPEQFGQGPIDFINSTFGTDGHRPAVMHYDMKPSSPRDGTDVPGYSKIYNPEDAVLRKVDYYDANGNVVDTWHNPEVVQLEDRAAVKAARRQNWKVYQEVVDEHRAAIAEARLAVANLRRERELLVDRYMFMDQFMADNVARSFVQSWGGIRWNRRFSKVAAEELKARAERLDEAVTRRLELDPSNRVFTYDPAQGDRLNYQEWNLLPDENDPFYPLNDGSDTYNEWLQAAREHDDLVVNAVASGTLSPRDGTNYLLAPQRPEVMTLNDDVIAARDRLDDASEQLELNYQRGRGTQAGVRYWTDQARRLQAKIHDHNRRVTYEVLYGRANADDAEQFLAGRRDLYAQASGRRDLEHVRKYAEGGPLPGEVYHATTNLEAVQSEGVRSTEWVSRSNPEPAGLGGPTEDQISVGTSREAAEKTAESHRFVARVTQGKYTPEQLWQMSADEGWGIDEDFMRSIRGRSMVDLPGGPGARVGTKQDFLDWAERMSADPQKRAEMAARLITARAKNNPEAFIDPYYVSIRGDRWLGLDPEKDIGAVKLSQVTPIRRAGDFVHDQGAGTGMEYKLPDSGDMLVNDTRTDMFRAARDGAGLRADQLQELRRLDADIRQYKESFERLRSLKNNTKRYDNDGVIIINGNAYPDAFNGASGEAARKASSSDDTWNASIQDPVQFQTSASDRIIGYDYGAIKPGAGNYYDELARTFNQHWRNDPLYRVILSNSQPEQVLQWMTETSAGRSYMRKMGISDNPVTMRQYVYDKVQQADSYTMNNPILQRAILDRRITPNELKSFLPEGDPKLPTIHGRQGSGIALSGEEPGLYRQVVGGLFKVLGTIPENKLARHPFYAQRYQSKLAATVQSEILQRQKILREKLAKREITEEEFARGMNTPPSNEEKMRAHYAAHSYALAETKRTLYTLDRISNLSAVMRFVSPFFPAFENSLRTWGHIAWQDPSIVPIADKLYNMPERFSDPKEKGVITVYDKDGNPVTDPSHGMTNDHTIRFRIPPGWLNYVKKIPGLHYLPGATEAISSLDPMVKYFSDMLSANDVGKGSFNLPFPETQWYMPGFGPQITIPASEILKNSPRDLGKEVTIHIGNDTVTLPGLDKLMPYGTDRSTGSINMAFPKSLRMAGQIYRETTSADPANDRAFAVKADMILRDQLQRYDTHQRPDLPTMKEVYARAKALTWLDFISAVVSPFQVHPVNKYQFYIDQYHRLQRQNYQTAPEKFTKQFGDEFWRYLFSTTESDANLPPTNDGFDLVRQHPELVEKLAKSNPDIIGVMTQGKKSGYNANVYDWMVNRPVAEGSDVMMRRVLKPQEFMDKMEVSRAWQKFNEAKLQLKQEAVARAAQDGSKPSISPTNNVDLWNKQQQYIEYLKKKSPLWSKDFEDKDETKFKRNLNSFETIVSDPKFWSQNHNVPEWQAVKKYLESRQMVFTEVKQREAAGISKPSFGLNDWNNADLKKKWEEYLAYLAYKAPQFDTWHDRYFSISGKDNLIANNVLAWDMFTGKPANVSRYGNVTGYEYGGQ